MTEAELKRYFKAAKKAGYRNVWVQHPDGTRLGFADDEQVPTVEINQWDKLLGGSNEDR